MLRIKELLILISFLVSCQRHVDGVITVDGIDIVFHDINSSGSAVSKGDFINLKLIVTDDDDSLVFNSAYNGLNGVSSFLYDSSIYNSFYSELFQNVLEGDSVSFSTSLLEFLNCFLKYDNSDSQLTDEIIQINLRLISYCSHSQQDVLMKELTLKAIEKEANMIYQEKYKWDSLYDDIVIVDSMYSKLITKNTHQFMMNIDSFKDYYVLDYSLKDLNGRVLFITDPYKPHFFEKHKQGQLLKGFDLLLNKYDSGDSVYAILPSDLAFHEKGAFSVMIPPFTPLLLSLRIR